MTKISLTPEGSTLRITLSHGPANTLTPGLMTEWIERLSTIKSEPPANRPRCLILCSSLPGIFSQGIDPKALLSADIDGRTNIFRLLGSLVEAFLSLYIPIVTVIDGSALAGGAVLSQLGHVRLIHRQAGKISFSELKVGLPVPGFVQSLISQSVLPQHWADVTLFGRNYVGDEALGVGLATSVFADAAERDAQIANYVGRLDRLPPEAVSATLRDRHVPLLASLKAFEVEGASFRAFLGENYLERGLSALIRGESPKF